MRRRNWDILAPRKRNCRVSGPGNSDQLYFRHYSQRSVAVPIVTSILDDVLSVDDMPTFNVRVRYGEISPLIIDWNGMDHTVSNICRSLSKRDYGSSFLR